MKYLYLFCRVFIPVSNGTKIIKLTNKHGELWLQEKKHFLMGHSVVLCLVQHLYNQ